MLFLLVANVCLTLTHRVTSDDHLLLQSLPSSVRLATSPTEPAKSRCLIQRSDAKQTLKAGKPLADATAVAESDLHKQSVVLPPISETYSEAPELPSAAAAAGENTLLKPRSMLLANFVSTAKFAGVLSGGSSKALLGETPLWLRSGGGGLILGAVIGMLVVPLMPYAAAPVVGTSALIGGAMGGCMGMLAEAGPVPMDDLRKSLGLSVGNTETFDEPLMEKLYHLASEIIAVDKYEGEHDKNATEAQAYKKDMKEAKEAFARIAEARRQLTSGNDPMANKATRKQLESDFQTLEEEVSHGDTELFVSANTALENGAILTEYDLAMLEGTRGEDIGFKNGSKLESMQGDMIPGRENQIKETLSSVQTAAEGNQTRVAAGDPWTDGKVKYCYAPEVSVHARHLFEAATKIFENGIPCFDFQDVGLKSGNSESPMSEQHCKQSPAIFVQNNPKEGCYAYVGMVSSMPSQRLQLREPACLSLGTVLHEIGHALGMGHEQSRPDRDKHIRIWWRNIDKKKRQNFAIINGAIDSTEYDPLSIMQYDNYAFATGAKHFKTGETYTIEYVGQGTHDTLGQRIGLSDLDVADIAHLYSCTRNQLDGEGCVDTPDKDGSDMCSGIKECNNNALVASCCACGGGTKVQCYKNRECPRPKTLPINSYSLCIKDITLLYKAAAPHIPCIYQNLCDYDVSFSCSNLPCSHKALSKKAAAASCQHNGKPVYQTQICSSVQNCTITKA